MIHLLIALIFMVGKAQEKKIPNSYKIEAAQNQKIQEDNSEAKKKENLKIDLQIDPHFLIEEGIKLKDLRKCKIYVDPIGKSVWWNRFRVALKRSLETEGFLLTELLEKEAEARFTIEGGRLIIVNKPGEVIWSYKIKKKTKVNLVAENAIKNLEAKLNERIEK